MRRTSVRPRSHAHQGALLAWLRNFRQAPMRTFVVHGDAGIAQTFARIVQEQLGWTTVSVPQYGDAFALT